jgi:hypothetical protein
VTCDRPSVVTINFCEKAQQTFGLDWGKLNWQDQIQVNPSLNTPCGTPY